MLEGERRSFENVKSDFMRRIKMLEYALRVERYVCHPPGIVFTSIIAHFDFQIVPKIPSRQKASLLDLARHRRAIRAPRARMTRARASYTKMAVQEVPPRAKVMRRFM